MTKRNVDRHLHSLDALRGFAALSVVCFHYANFMTVGNTLDESLRPLMPFHKYLSLLLDNGWMAVDLFFTISGFVFFWLYGEKIREGRIDGRQFFLLRFSRLYPLHFATLLLVALLQLLYGHLHPDLPYFQTKENDIGHFVLQLFFASNWLERFGYSFNSPIWSVSIEVLLYILFFGTCSRCRPNLLLLSVICVIGWWYIYRFNMPLGRGLGSFFAGGIAYKLFRLEIGRRHGAHIIVATVIIWIVGVFGILDNWSLLPNRLAVRARYFPEALMFPLAVVSVAIAEQNWNFGRSMAWLGNISYSTYLIHFPLQLLLVIAVDVAGIDRKIFFSPLAFVGYFVLLIPLSMACFVYFEKPAQRAAREFFAPSLQPAG